MAQFVAEATPQVREILGAHGTDGSLGAVAFVGGFVESFQRTRMPNLSFRPATPDDLDRLVEIHTMAFPDPRGHEERRRNFLAKPFGPFADLHVAVVTGGARAEIVAHAFAFGLSVGIGGATVPVTGIATVGVAPEARGRGVAKRLIEHVLAVGEASGAVASFLYPFRQGFYARLGYVSAPHVHHLAVAPESLVSLAKLGHGIRVRRAHGDDRQVLHDLYSAEVGRSTGLLVRSERLWNMHLSDERRAIFVGERAGEACGYVSMITHQAEAHGEIRTEVLDLVGGSFADRAAMLGWLGGLRDQVSEVDVCLAADDPLLPALLDLDVDRKRVAGAGTGVGARVEHPIGVLGTGPMLRIPSPRRALVARGYRRDGAFEISVGGDTFGLVIASGSAMIVRSAKGPRLAFTPEGLAAVAYGGLPLARAVALGWASGDEEAVFLAARVLEVPAWHTWDRF